jgi:putative acetyltransferase
MAPPEAGAGLNGGRRRAAAWKTHPMRVRREQAGDVAAVRQVVAAAFAKPETAGAVPIEVTLLDALRDDKGWLPTLSLIALDPAGDGVVGHVVCTRGTVDGHPALGLGPLAVRPDRQRGGVGKALMHAVLGAADALDEPLVVLLGDPDYYGRYGFEPSTAYGIVAPDPAWGRYFQVRTLSAYRPMAGTFAYAAPFDDL